jgi:hypothetical protein
VNLSCVGASDLGRQPLAAAWPVNRTRTAKNRPLNHLLTEPNRTWLGSVRTHSTAGNHEFYHGEYAEVDTTLRSLCAHAGVHYLSNETIDINGVRFVAEIENAKP